MIANSTNAKPPSTATRTASCGVMAGRRSSRLGGMAQARRQRAEPAGRVGAAAAAARIVGQERRAATRRTTAYTGSASSVLRTIISRIWRTSRSETGASTPSRNCMHREADRGDGGGDRADRDRDEPVGRVAQLAQAPGAVADGGAARARRRRASAAARCRRTGRRRSRTARPAPSRISRPTDTTISGERSAGTPNTVICDTAVSCRMPPNSPSAARRAMAGAGRGHGDRRSRRAGRCAGFVSTSTYSSRRRSAAGRTWMRRSSSPSPSSTRLTVPIRIPGGNSDFSRVETVPAVTMRSPLLDELAVRDELEQQVAGRADGGVDRARLARAGAPWRRRRTPGR